MPEWINSMPFALALATLTLIGFLRGQGTYWVARLAVQGTTRVTARSAGWRHRVASWLGGPRVARGRAALERWGLPLISLCYLTLGLQTVVLASAGVLRIGWIRFTLAQLPGAFAWGLIYSTIGFAAWDAAIGAAAASPIGLAVIAIAVVVIVTLVVRSNGRRRADRAASHR